MLHIVLSGTLPEHTLQIDLNKIDEGKRNYVYFFSLLVQSSFEGSFLSVI